MSSPPPIRICGLAQNRRAIVKGAHNLRELYEALGAKPTWTCAPYQLPGRPRLGDHIVAGESNAVTFYNSVIGARTNKYGDYLDVACAMIGKAPLAGLHTDQGRKAALLFRLKHIDPALLDDQIFFHLLGHHLGRIAGRRIPAIEGLPPEAAEDDLRALSAAVASSGGVDLWHGIGVTPEAPDLASVFADGDTHDVTLADLIAARDDLSSGRDGPLDMVALGTPHFSFAEFAALHRLLDGRRIKSGLVFYVSTSRFVRSLIEKEGWLADFERAGITIVTDVCTYYSPGRARRQGPRHDQCREMGLLRAGHARRRSLLRQPEGMRRIGGARRSLARSRTRANARRMISARILHAGTADGTRTAPRCALELLGRLRAFDRRHRRRASSAARHQSRRARSF